MTVENNKELSPPRAALAVTTCLVVVLAFMIAAAYGRGIWTDEVWTLWMSQHDLTVPNLFAQRWTQDVHPPFFFAMAWLFDPITGSDIFLRRLLNLFPTAYLVTVATYVALHARRAQHFVMVFLIISLINHYPIVYFTEHRSYYSCMCFTAAMLTCLYALLTTRQDFRPDLDRGLAFFLICSTIMALSTHYIGAVINGALLAVVILELWRRRQRSWAILLFAAGVVAFFLLASAYYSQTAYMKTIVNSFWVTTKLSNAIYYIAYVIGRTALENIVAAVAAVLALLTYARSRRASAVTGPDGTATEASMWRFCATIFVGLAVASVSLLVVNLVRPVVIPRYLIPMAPISASLIAALAAERVLARWWIFGAFLVNAALVGVVEAHYAGKVYWNSAFERIHAQVAACPSTLVYVIDPEFLYKSDKIPNHAAVLRWGYPFVARIHGFEAHIIDPAKAPSIPVSQSCPTIFWGEFMPLGDALTKLHTSLLTKGVITPANVNSTQLFQDPPPSPIDKSFILRNLDPDRFYTREISVVLTVPPPKSPGSTPSSHQS